MKSKSKILMLIIVTVLGYSTSCKEKATKHEKPVFEDAAFNLWATSLFDEANVNSVITMKIDNNGLITIVIDPEIEAPKFKSGAKPDSSWVYWGKASDALTIGKFCDNMSLIYSSGHYESTAIPVFGKTDKEIYYRESQNDLNLVSPNGIRIAKDVNSLKHNTSVFLKTLNKGTEIDPEITNIEYFDTEKGFAAFVEYETSDGKIGKYALLSRNAGISLVAKTMEVIKPKFESKSENSVIAVGCTGTCSDSECSIRMADDTAKGSCSEDDKCETITGKRLECSTDCETCVMLICERIE